MFGMRRCRINLPNRCYHLISRVAHRAYFLDEDERLQGRRMAMKIDGEYDFRWITIGKFRRMAEEVGIGLRIL